MRCGQASRAGAWRTRAVERVDEDSDVTQRHDAILRSHAAAEVAAQLRAALSRRLLAVLAGDEGGGGAHAAAGRVRIHRAGDIFLADDSQPGPSTLESLGDDRLRGKVCRCQCGSRIAGDLVVDLLNRIAVALQCEVHAPNFRRSASRRINAGRQQLRQRDLCW